MFNRSRDISFHHKNTFEDATRCWITGKKMMFWLFLLRECYVTTSQINVRSAEVTNGASLHHTYAFNGLVFCTKYQPNKIKLKTKVFVAIPNGHARKCPKKTKEGQSLRDCPCFGNSNIRKIWGLGRNDVFEVMFWKNVNPFIQRSEKTPCMLGEYFCFSDCD